MTIEQANQYFAALPDGFASTEQLRAAFTAPVQKVQFVGVAGTAGKTVTARLLAAILHAQGIHAGLYHAGCRPLSERICIDDAPVDEGLLALTADALSAAEALPQDAAELAAAVSYTHLTLPSWPLRPTALAQRAARWPWWNCRMRALRKRCPACRCAPSPRSARTV